MAQWIGTYGCQAARSSGDDGEPVIGRAIRVAPSDDASRPFAALIDCPGCRERHLIRPSWRKLNPDEPQRPDLTLPAGLEPGRNPHNPYRSRAAAQAGGSGLADRS
jgi:hypothetical protein